MQPAPLFIGRVMSKLLALDQASRVSGWSVWDKDTKKYVAHGHFTFDSPDFDTRLYRINRKVKSLIEEYDVDEVYLEDIQLQDGATNNVDTFKKLAEVLGTLCCLCVELDIKHTTVLNVVWFKACGLRGRQRPERKRAAQAHVLENFGIKATQDEADAICIGEYAMMQQNPNDWSE